MNSSLPPIRTANGSQEDQSTAPKRMSLGDLATQLGAELHGDPEIQISGVGAIESAHPEQITFIANAKYAGRAKITAAAAILVEPGFPELSRPTLRIQNPYLAFAEALELFHPAVHHAPTIHPTAVIAESATLGRGCHVGPYAVIMDDVVIGDHGVILAHVVIYPRVQTGKHLLAHAHAVIREDCTLGDNVILQNGAVVGGDGFGFARDAERRWRKIPQTGPVLLADDVEVQSNACVDRASIGTTRIGRGSKIDNLVQVGHGSQVGEDTLLCAQVGLAGSTRVGDRVVLAGQVGVAGHCTIGNDVTATAQSGIPGDVADGLVMSGYPAVENRRWLKSVALLNRLPGLLRNIKEAQR